jgi:hypothetical protein
MHDAIRPMGHGALITIIVLIIIYSLVRNSDSIVVAFMLCCLIIPVYAVVVATLEIVKGWLQ